MYKREALYRCTGVSGIDVLLTDMMHLCTYIAVSAETKVRIFEHSVIKYLVNKCFVFIKLWQKCNYFYFVD